MAAMKKSYQCQENEKTKTILKQIARRNLSFSLQFIQFLQGLLHLTMVLDYLFAETRRFGLLLKYQELKNVLKETDKGLDCHKSFLL